jgi:PadR family transcriptional regulator PadR
MPASSLETARATFTANPIKVARRLRFSRSIDAASVSRPAAAVTSGHLAIVLPGLHEKYIDRSSGSYYALQGSGHGALAITRWSKPSGSMDNFFDNWTVQVRKGLLELCILNALANEERYGYDLVKTLVETHGLGVSEGTIYPLLSRLRVAGLIASRLEESSSGPARKYYSLTKEGRKTMETMNDYLIELNRSVTRLRTKGA